SIDAIVTAAHARLGGMVTGWQVENHSAKAGHGWLAADQALQPLDPTKPSPGVYRARRIGKVQNSAFSTGCQSFPFAQRQGESHVDSRCLERSGTGAGSGNGNPTLDIIGGLIQKSGGIGGLVSTLQQGGLGGVVNSWLGNGANQSV